MPVREVLCGQVRAAVADAGDLLSGAADQVFRGHRGGAGIAWRLADSLALRRFVGISLDEYTPDHSTISRTRRLIHVGAFNLSLILRKLLGAGTPRELKNSSGQVFYRLLRFLLGLGKAVSRIPLCSPAAGPQRQPSRPCRTPDHRSRFFSSSATDC